MIFPAVGFSVSSFLQCFDTVVSATERTPACGKLVLLVLYNYIPEQVVEKN